MPTPPDPNPVFGNLKCKTLEAESIIVKKGTTKISIVAMAEGGGFWIERGTGNPIVAIYNLETQNCIGLYNANPNQGIQVGLGVSEDGPFVQLINNAGDVKMLSYDDFQMSKNINIGVAQKQPIVPPVN